MKNKISLNINGNQIEFNVDETAQEHLIDAMQADNKVAPMHTFLMRTVTPETKEKLKPFLKNPASTMEIGSKLIEEFTPKLQITVGE